MLSINESGPSDPVPASFHAARHVLWDNETPDDRIALVVVSTSGAERWSFGRLRNAVLSAAGGLRQNALAPGQRVLFRLGNTPVFPIAFLGAITAGLVPVPTSAALSSAEAQHLIDVVRPSAILSDGSAAVPESAVTLLGPDSLNGPHADLPEHGDPETPAYILFTSGTSGPPLAVVHAHRAIWARLSMLSGWSDIDSKDRVLHAGAFNWSYTLGIGLLDPWSVGATALIAKPGTDLSALPLLLNRHEATIFAAVPGVFRRLLRADLPKLPKLRHALSAGENLPADLRVAWQNRTGTDIHEAFGQTEISTFISGSPNRPAPQGAIGYAQPGRRVAIIGEDGPVLIGDTGVIAIDASDPGAMLEYLDRPEETAERRQGEWIKTGDLGRMSEDGAFTYLGRSDDLLTAGGFRVSPLEVEEAMLTHPEIQEAAAVDHTLPSGARVIALHFVSQSSLDETGLAAHAETRLARHKRPRIFVRMDQLPRSANGKLLRARLRAANEDAT